MHGVIILKKKYAAILIKTGFTLALLLAVVLSVHGLWEKWYVPLIAQAKPEFIFSETVLVNKEHQIPVDYSPELVQIEGISLHKAAAASWKRMSEAAEANGITLRPTLGFCSPDESLRDISGESSGLQQSCKTPAFQNEHNIGLAVDVSLDDAAQEWLEQNMYKYGFVLRYSKQKEAVTGVTAQPHHLRFVGTQAAKMMTRIPQQFTIKSV